MSEDRKKKARVKQTDLIPAQDNQQEETTIDLYELLLKYLDKWRWIALCAVAGALIMLFYTIWFVTPLYKATAKIYVLSTKDSVLNLSDLQISTYLANDYTEVYTNWELHEEVIKDLTARKQAGEEDLQNIDIDRYTYTMLSNMISISNPSGTRILYITITSEDPNEAKVLANTYAEVSKEFIAKRMDTSAPKEFERARRPLSPSSPNVARNAILGFLVGAVLAMAVITLRFIVDDYVRTADDVEKYLHLPTLGSIMLQKQSDDDTEPVLKRKKKDNNPDDDDEAEPILRQRKKGGKSDDDDE